MDLNTVTITFISMIFSKLMPHQMKRSSDAFLADVIKIDSAILDGKNRNLYAQKRDIIIQAKGMKNRFI